jgi:hypothetical protein
MHNSHNDSYDHSPSDHRLDHLHDDPDRGKGSREPDEPAQSSNNSMKDQLPHRAADPLQDGADSDFPEPGPSPEHSFEGEQQDRELKKRKAS